MRVALVTAAFRARAPFDLPSHVRSLAPALARAGARVEVFCAVRDSGLAPFAQRRTEVIDHVSGAPFGVTAIEAPDGPSFAARRSSPTDGLGRDERDVRLADGFGAFLDRERPTVVHFERLDAFGTQLVREAKARGIATVYCADDTWPAHDRVSLLLPDLSPFELGDGESEARALLAERELGPVPPSGKFESSAANERLKTLLHQPLTALEDVAALRDASEEVDVRRAKKRAALSAVDRRFATSRLLAKELSAGVGRAFTFRAAGVDTTLFRVAPDAGAERAGSVRFVFLGTTAPETGIDRLLDAFASMRAGANPSSAQLALHLECTNDPTRDAAVAERADELEIETRWSRGPVDAVGALQSADAVVMPSLWGEVSPTMCRIALACGKPLVASRTSGVMEAMPSSAGVLVSPGDTKDLAEAMTRLAAGGADLDAVVAGATEASRATKAIDDEAREWLDTYNQMGSARPAGSYTASHSKARPAASSPLPGVEEIAATLRELQELSTAELFSRAQEGIGKLRRAFGLKDSDADLLARVVARGGGARDRAEHEVILRGELEHSLSVLQAARSAMQAEEAVRVRRVSDLHAVLGQYEQEVLTRSQAAEEAEERARGLREAAEASDRTTRALEEKVSSLEGAREAAAEEVESARSRAARVAAEADKVRASLADVEAERARLVETLDERDALVRSLRERLGAPVDVETDGKPKPAGARDLQSELESIEAFCVALERDTEALKNHDEWVYAESERLVEALEAATGGARSTPDVAGAGEASISRGFAMLERLSAELDWRRKEMESARTASSSLRTRMLAGPLASRVRAWGTSPTWATVPLDRVESTSDNAEEPAAPLPLRPDAGEDEAPSAAADDAESGEPESGESDRNNRTETQEAAAKEAAQS